MLPGISTSNPVFQGGLGLMVIGGLLASLRQIPSRIISLIQQRLYIEVVVHDGDPAFYWLSAWLAQHSKAKPATSMRAVSRHETSPGTGTQTRRTKLIPGEGEHIIKYRGATMWITIAERQAGQAFEHLLKARCRKRHRAQLEQLLQEADELEEQPDPDSTHVYLYTWDSWRHHMSRRRRSRESVLLPEGEYEALLADMQWFLANFAWYESLGIPYRRGYLFHGPPGNGKSSLIAALASELRRNLYVLQLGDATMNDQRLMQLMGAVPGNALVVVEDIDTVFRGRAREAENKLTLTGLLNAIDGPLATEGRILIMTTNHPEVLDPALIRPGRTDRQIELKNANPWQAARLFERFLPDAPTSERDAFVAWGGSGEHSMAALQERLVELVAARRG